MRNQKSEALCVSAPLWLISLHSAKGLQHIKRSSDARDTFPELADFFLSEVSEQKTGLS
jgi:hypothetical protein